MIGARRYAWVRSRKLAISLLLSCGIVAWLVWLAASGRPKPPPYRKLLEDRPLAAAPDSTMESRIEAFCGDCHALPRPESFPRDRWHEEVQRGYSFYARSGRSDLDPPPMHQTVAYFRTRAPEEPVFPQPADAETELRASFVVERLVWDHRAGVMPEISHLRWTQLDPTRRPVLLACDMRYGFIAAVDLDDRNSAPQVLARLHHPARIEPCDLDGDGHIDLLAADLGSSYPADHDQGRVVWLRRQPESNTFEEIVLASGLGRVADVRPGDFDGDGLLDLVVAEFGHYRTGKIALLRNVAQSGERPSFRLEEIDSRPGTIHVPVHDLNGDGQPDFLALVSQDYECVEAFVNQGDARFQLRTLFRGPDLTFGSSGIELVDLDGDGDLDILYTNGDAWDNWYATPSHGVQWLENRGELEFAYHHLAHLPGAYRALAGDIDLDGDLDIVVVTWLPRQLMPSGLASQPLTSILCLEQTAPGVFVRHTLETGSPDYATFELADFDGDGDLDFAVASGPYMAGSPNESPWLALWRNQVR